MSGCGEGELGGFWEEAAMAPYEPILEEEARAVAEFVLNAMIDDMRLRGPDGRQFGWGNWHIWSPIQIIDWAKRHGLTLREG